MKKLSFNSLLSSGLDLSYGNFDVAFFPEKQNFFDASQEISRLFSPWMSQNFHFLKLGKRCANLRGELPVPRNWEDVEALGQVMIQYNETKIWSAVVDGTPGLQNGNQKFWNYNTKDYLGNIRMFIFQVQYFFRWRFDSLVSFL